MHQISITACKNSTNETNLKISSADFPAIFSFKIKHFFEHYKDLEKGKWVKVTGFEDAAKARELIAEAIERAKK